MLGSARVFTLAETLPAFGDFANLHVDSSLFMPSLVASLAMFSKGIQDAIA
jgi:hypothetical protein